MINIITYQTTNPHNSNYTWLAYVVLPNGEFWNIRFNGATEDIARHRAASLWEKESEKVLARFKPNPKPTDKSLCVKSVRPSPDSPRSEKPLSADPGASEVMKYSNTVSMSHATEGLKRVALTEITMYEGNGWYRSEPRSK